MQHFNTIQKLFITCQLNPSFAFDSERQETSNWLERERWRKRLPVDYFSAGNLLPVLVHPPTKMVGHREESPTSNFLASLLNLKEQNSKQMTRIYKNNIIRRMCSTGCRSSNGSFCPVSL